jgi:hypothetical protein
MVVPPFIGIVRIDQKFIVHTTLWVLCHGILDGPVSICQPQGQRQVQRDLYKSPEIQRAKLFVDTVSRLLISEYLDYGIPDTDSSTRHEHQILYIFMGHR